MGAARPTLRQQASATALAAVNLGGHIDNLKHLVRTGRRRKWELVHACSYHPALEAAARTLAWMEKHEADIRTMIKEKRGAA